MDLAKLIKLQFKRFIYNDLDSNDNGIKQRSCPEIEQLL